MRLKRVVLPCIAGALRPVEFLAQEPLLEFDLSEDPWKCACKSQERQRGLEECKEGSVQRACISIEFVMFCIQTCSGRRGKPKRYDEMSCPYRKLIV